MPYVTITTETKPANCSPLFKWSNFNLDSNFQEYRKKYYVDTGLILSTATVYRDSNNQICNSTSNVQLAFVKVITTFFANQESLLRWRDDSYRKIKMQEKLNNNNLYRIEKNTIEENR